MRRRRRKRISGRTRSHGEKNPGQNYPGCCESEDPSTKKTGAMSRVVLVNGDHTDHHKKNNPPTDAEGLQEQQNGRGEGCAKERITKNES